MKVSFLNQIPSPAARSQSRRLCGLSISPDTPASLPRRDRRPRRETTTAPPCRGPNCLPARQAFVGGQQSAAEFLEHAEEACLVAVIGGAVDHLELHDHIDGHP